MSEEVKEKQVHVWAAENFGGAKLGDVRTTRRLINVAKKMALNTGKSLPKTFDANSELKASYKLFDQPNVSPNRLQKPHKANTYLKMSQPGTYLLIEDTTELTWSNRSDIDGLSSVNGNRSYQSMLLHTALCVGYNTNELRSNVLAKRPILEIKGIAAQEFYIRKPKAERRKCAPEGKYKGETQLWHNSLNQMPVHTSSDCRYVRVADRGADIYDVLNETKEHGYGYVIRARANRLLEDGNGEKLAVKLFENVNEAPNLGSFTLSLRRGQSRKRQDVVLFVSAKKVYLRSPQVVGSPAGKRPAHECYALLVREKQSKKNMDPLLWVLLTDMPIESFEDALTTARQYACRWIIEEYHKALKTGGMKVESLQLETSERLSNAISIMSIVALRLLTLREILRQDPLAPAKQSGLTEIELKLLARKLKRKLKTVEDVNLALGRLGGHLNRKADGYPGYQSLWEGMLYLQTLVHGYRLALEIRAN